MRVNTQALTSDPRFSFVETPKQGKWGKLKFQNPREAHKAAVAWARTGNEQVWQSSGFNWQGLGAQPRDDFDACGIAQKPRDLMKNATATLVRKPSRAGKSAPAITGGTWSVPAVLANLPLAAIARQRTKLPPVNLRLALTWSSSVRDETLAPTFAKLARSIWDYTLAGGAVTLTVYGCGKVRSSTSGAKGLIVECRVPATDIAQLSLGLSVVFLRTIAGPLCTAFSGYPSDNILVPDPSEIPLPAGTIYIGGRTRSGDIGSNLDDALKTLQVS